VPARDVLRFPHADLKRACSPVGAGDVSGLVADLRETMAGFGRCVGIAAPQVGEVVRVCVVDCSVNPKVDSHHGLLVLVDPVVVSASAESEVAREGCLSIPDFTANVRRACSVVVSARDVEPFEAVGFEARVLLHEIDHLDGLLFLDRVASVKDDVFRRKRYA
jgi:peptide deformylase